MKELRGTESTRKSIQKLKKGERMPTHSVGNTELPTIRQSIGQAVNILISYRGVQFVDIQSQVGIHIDALENRETKFKTNQNVVTGNNLRTRNSKH